MPTKNYDEVLAREVLKIERGGVVYSVSPVTMFQLTEAERIRDEWASRYAEGDEGADFNTGLADIVHALAPSLKRSECETLTGQDQPYTFVMMLLQDLFNYHRTGLVGDLGNVGSPAAASR